MMSNSIRCIGIDIGGTKIAGGIVSPAGKVIVREERPTPVKDGGKKILAEAIAIVASLKGSRPRSAHPPGSAFLTSA